MGESKHGGSRVKLEYVFLSSPLFLMSISSSIKLESLP